MVNLDTQKFCPLLVFTCAAVNLLLLLLLLLVEQLRVFWRVFRLYLPAGINRSRIGAELSQQITSDLENSFDPNEATVSP